MVQEVRDVGHAEDGRRGADGERGADGLVDVGLALGDGVRKGAPERERGGDRRGERAAGAVRRGGVFDDGRGIDELALVADEQVLGRRVRGVAALHEDGAAGRGADAARGLGHRRARADFRSREDFGLGEVGRRERGDGQHPRAHRVDRVVAQELRAARRDHHGVDDDRRAAPGGELRGDGLDHLARGEHAGLGGADRVGGQDRVELRGDEVRVRHVDGRDAGGVLRGERGEDGAGVEPERVERADVGLDAGVAAAVASRDGEGGGLPPVEECHLHFATPRRSGGRASRWRRAPRRRACP